MRYLCRLITPPGGVVVDPFLGSGTTGIAAALEGFHFIGIEQDAESVRTAVARLTYWMAQSPRSPVTRPRPRPGIRRNSGSDLQIEELPLFEEPA
jgi:site-specific DNA-methyltransferase (adenine-specific)